MSLQLHEHVTRLDHEAPERQRKFRATVLDPRTYHLFRDPKGQPLFYDVHSGRLGELNEFSYRLLELCGQHDWEEVQRRISAEHDLDWDPSEGFASIQELKDQGFFAFESFDLREQQSFLISLWNHKPIRLQLLMAQMCNLKCLYCYEEHNGSNARRRLMSFEMAKECVDYLVERSGTREGLQLTFFGGEPLLNWKVIKQVVAYCRELETTTSKRFTFELITNGTLLTPEVVEFLLQHRFLLMVSLDGYREMNNFNRPSVSGADYYDRILANGRYADQAYKRSKIGISVKVRANLTHEFHDLKKTVGFLESQGFTTIGISTVDDLPWSEGKLHACTAEDLDEVARMRQELISEGLENMRAGKRVGPYTMRIIKESVQEVKGAPATRGLKCGVGRNTNIVDTEGKIYPCHRYGDMEQYVIGDVKQRSLDRERMMAYYRSVNHASMSVCQDCWARHICAGPCAWEVSNPNGTIHGPEENHCRRIRSSIENALLLRRALQKEFPELLPRVDPSSSCGCGPEKC